MHKKSLAGFGRQAFSGVFEMKKDIIYEIPDTCGSL